MKKILIAIFSVLCSIAYGQNVPDGSIFSSGTYNPTISVPSGYSLGSSPLYNYVRTFEPQYPQTSEAAINEAATGPYLNTSTTYVNGNSLQPAREI